MAKFPGFIGPSYQPSDYSIDSQKTSNFFTEKVESGEARSPNQYALLRTPGRKLYLDPGCGLGTVRGEFGIEGYLFGVVRDQVFEQFPDGTVKVFGLNVQNDNKPAYLAGTSDAMVIISGGFGYVIQNGDLVQITDPGFPQGKAKGLALINGYFMTGVAGTKYFQISDLNAPLVWDPTQKAAKDTKLDYIHNIKSCSGEMWALGSQTMEIFDNIGDVDFPFAPRTDVAIDLGLWADDSALDMGNSLYLVAGNDKGVDTAMRTEGYSLRRISNHPIEEFFSKNKNSMDMVSWGYGESGHVFWCLYSPSANRTVCYDVATQQWHDRTWLNPATGQEEAHRAYCATSVNGKVVVGDRIDGKIYELSSTYLDDAGDLIRRVRRTPVLNEQLLNIVHFNLQLDGNMGLGTVNISDPTDPRYDPKGILRWSDDGGKNWSNEHWRGFGRAGNYTRRAIWRGLGFARRRVYEFSVTAPAEWGFSAAYINNKLNAT